MAKQKGTAPPDEIRAFGCVLKLAKRSDFVHGFPTWKGATTEGQPVMLFRTDDDSYKAAVVINDIAIEPYLHSSSYKAAFRNLRGMLGNLEISIGKLLRGQRKKLKRGAE